MEQEIFRRNLLALSASSPQCAQLMTQVQPSREYQIQTARNGSKVPVFHAAETPLWLHSSFDPEAEGKRLLTLHTDGDFLIVAGFGAAYHIMPFLNKTTLSALVIVEKDPEFLRLILSAFDFCALLTDPRIVLLVDKKPEEIFSFLVASYIPAIHGNLNAVIHRPLVRINKPYYEEVFASVSKAIDLFKDDYTVQANFGIRWFKNILRNLQAVLESHFRFPLVPTALVAAAGPSFDSQADTLRAMQQNSFLIAADTILPALMDRKITPNCIVSIDCQHISYYHFLNGLPADVPLFLDIASPPQLTRLTPNPLFFSSSHPLSQYISLHCKKLPFIDTSGGNVTHSALFLARELGAEEIYLFGLDLCYPQLKCYAKSTYLHRYFKMRENRIEPLESQFCSFVFKNKKTIADKVNGITCYTTLQMQNYRKRMEQLIRSLSAQAYQIPGEGFPLSISKTREKAKRSTEIKLFSSGPAQQTYTEFLQGYYQELAGLPKITLPFSKYLQQCTQNQQQVWMTLFPCLAAFREKQHQTKDITKLLKAVQEWAVEFTKHLLRS